MKGSYRLEALQQIEPQHSKRGSTAAHHPDRQSQHPSGCRSGPACSSHREAHTSHRVEIGKRRFPDFQSSPVQYSSLLDRGTTVCDKLKVRNSSPKEDRPKVTHISALCSFPFSDVGTTEICTIESTPRNPMLPAAAACRERNKQISSRCYHEGITEMLVQ